MNAFPINKKIVKGIKRTVTAIQHDTLDSICYRYFGANANDYLPRLIELNANFAPVAILPMGSKIILPNNDDVSQTTTLKLWD